MSNANEDRASRSSQAIRGSIDSESCTTRPPEILSTEHRSDSSETTTFLSQGHTESSTEREDQSEDYRITSTEQLTWRPLTLRLPYISFVLMITILLASLVLFLTIDSNKNHGLGDDNASSSVLFGWRFSPTLLATIYGLLVASMLNDVRRTEIFARLSRPNGAPAETTLCFPTKPWWHDPKDALSKGTKSHALLFASMLYILALVVSPLSAGLLSPANEQISSPNTFQRAKTENFSWPSGSEDEIMFRTISGGVIGQSTSVWVSNSAAILPFWPSDYGNAPLGSKFASTSQSEQWQAQTTAFTVELDCQTMPLLTRYNATYNSTESGYGNYTFLQLGSPDDCLITLADYPGSETTWIYDGGGWWAPPPFYNTSLLKGMSNSTSNCGDRTMFFYATPASSPFRVQADLCSTSFYSSEILATVALNQSSTNVTFDQGESLRNRRPLDPAEYNVSQLHDAFFSSNWSSHFIRFPDEDTPIFGGPLMSIAAGDKYSNNITKLLASSTLPQEANELYQQFLGEMLLAALSPGIEENAEKETDTSSEKTKDPRPIVLQGWTGALLGSLLLLLTAAITVLYIVSVTAGLHQAPFVYRIDAHILETATTLAPYKIVPTLLALIAKLWFGAVGDALKLLQPYISMVKAPVAADKSILVEYVNTPIALAATKALNNAHWTLALVALGALASEFFTVGMSALWDLEVRSMNHFKDYVSPHGTEIDSAHTAALSDIYQSSLQSWLYGAAVEISQSGSAPAWTKDTWSFVPLDFGDIEEALTSTGSNATNVPGYSRNITFDTHGLRARLECRVMDYPKNTSLWLENIDFTNRTIDPVTKQSLWNATNSPPDLDHGYVLSGMANRGPRYGYYTCCANDSGHTPGETAIGYWNNQVWIDDDGTTGDFGFGGGSYQGSAMSMTAKLIVGPTLETLYRPNAPAHSTYPPLYIWTKQPDLVMVNCTPIIEHANMSVYAEIDTGVIHDYKILGSPQNATEAWIDNYLLHNISVDYTGEWEMSYGIGENISTYQNMTVSWGYLFWDALLNSGRASEVDMNKETEYSTMPESLSDRSFNFRVTGLNVDFMTYSMLALANNSKNALLDADTFMGLANQTFGTFFKHFVSDHVTSDSGGGAYQPIGEKLPWSLGPMVTYNSSSGEYQISGDQGALALENQTAPSSSFINATIHIPVEQLVMSSVSVYFCLSLLAFIFLVTVVMYIVNHNRIKQLPRNVDTLASTLAFVHGSEKLLAWTATAPKTKPWYKALLPAKSNTPIPKARIGNFKSSDGIERWGIELVDDAMLAQVEELDGTVELLDIQPKGQPTKNDSSSEMQSEVLETSESGQRDLGTSQTEPGLYHAEDGPAEQQRLIQDSRDHEKSETQIEADP
ncbi:hypothetical protein QM012_001535 [Aureobasidium pullulans]|uniref:Uncharacterized protein n=1 Tax=Aureobasidium pullulans TaxID=5580 RepID=A0ABR0TFQ2_AURPU